MPCQIPAREGQKFCHIHRRQRLWRWLFSAVGLGALAFTIISVVADITGLLTYFGITLPSISAPRTGVPPDATVTQPFPASASSADPDQLITIKQSFPAPGQGTEGITWDGAYLWLTDNSGKIFKVDTSGKVQGDYASPEVTPQGITWDGSSFWVFTTNYFFIYQFRIVGEEASILTSFRSPADVVGGGLSQDMAWDGSNLWYSNQFNIYKLDALGRIVNTIPTPENVTGLDWDGSSLWLAHNDFPDNSSLSIVDTEGNTLITLRSPILKITSLAWADGYLWTVGSDSEGEKPNIYKLDVSAARELIKP